MYLRIRGRQSHHFVLRIQVTWSFCFQDCQRLSHVTHFAQTLEEIPGSHVIRLDFIIGTLTAKPDSNQLNIAAVFVMSPSKSKTNTHLTQASQAPSNTSSIQRPPPALRQPQPYPATKPYYKPYNSNPPQNKQLRSHSAPSY